MKNLGGHVLANAINSVPPKGYKPMSKRRDEELTTDVEGVAEILKRLGHCPVEELVNAAKFGELTEQQRAAVNKWLMEMAYAKSTVSKVSGKVEHDHTHRAIQDIDGFLARHGLGLAEECPEKTGAH